eukprot:gene13232-9078_t
MNVVAVRSFSTYYNELKQWEPTYEDLLKTVSRDERAERQKIIDKEWSEMMDMLHIRGVWMTEKKLAEKGRLPHLEPRALAIWKQEREIWFPTVPPLAVPPPTNRVKYGYPFVKAKALMKEEKEMREWLEGVEKKRRGHIQEMSNASMYRITCFDDLFRKEERSRRRLEKDEYAIFTMIRKSVFIKAPPDYFRQKVIERYGRTDPLALKPKAASSDALPPVDLAPPAPAPAPAPPAASRPADAAPHNAVLPPIAPATTRPEQQVKPEPENTASTARTAPVTWKSLPPLSGRAPPIAAN